MRERERERGRERGNNTFRIDKKRTNFSAIA
jgi:hypothetical protein